MTDPFAAMAFCHPWRDYQASVLASLSTHLEDRKLHVSAAPGAGKTVLGLEVMRRIGKPTLILAPSIAIRNQWIDRLVELFLPDGADTSWITTDLSMPKLVTVATYQALHTDSDAAALKAAGIRVVVLDEAHHLRKAWWEALDETVEALDARTVALTATPPYDVSSAEWRRYHALCGPLDAEIDIPELVKSGDLAPHQDLVYHSTLSDPGKYAAYDRANAELREDLHSDAALCAVIAAHPWIADSRRNSDEVLSDPELFSAMLIYLNDAGHALPPYALRLLGVGQTEVPKLEDRWLQVLCQGLFDDLPDTVRAVLTRHGALSRGRVSIPLRDDEDRERLLRNAPEKYGSIRDIALAERKAMGDSLRMAILSEHVGANAVALAAKDAGFYAREAFARHVATNPKVGRLDAGSIFERLRLESGERGDMAVLTGSVCIVPTGSLSGEGITARPLPHDGRYDELILSGGASDRRVKLISDLMAAGCVRVLIGTRALLGQGWDLPAINTLVLATNVKSFVSSNQIRGRAIRRDPSVPGKVANIWHIATAAPNDPGPEIAALDRRFDTFMHLDRDVGKVRSGFGAFRDLGTMNARALGFANRRAAVATEWQDALVTGSPNPHIRRLVETSHDPRGLVRAEALAQVVPRLGIAGGVMAGWSLFLGDATTGILGGFASAAVLAPAVMRLKRVVDHGTLGGSLRQTGHAVLHGMIEAGLIRTVRNALTIETGIGEHGLGYCTLEGATLPEQTQFLSVIEELFAPIDNPRYLLIRESYLGNRLRMAPYPVPTELGRRKEHAQAFQDGWNRYVGAARLVFTRSVQGRLALLQARTVTLADAREVRRSSVWE